MPDRRPPKPTAAAIPGSAWPGRQQGRLARDSRSGREVREFRKRLDIDGLPSSPSSPTCRPAMLSKIENGMDLAVRWQPCRRLFGGALHVPVTAFFRKYEEERGRYLRAGRAGARDRAPAATRGRPPVPIARPHAAQGPVGRALPHHADRGFTDVFPIFQHAGSRVPLHAWRARSAIAMAAGPTGLTPGDSLFFDAGRAARAGRSAQAADPLPVDHLLPPRRGGVSTADGRARHPRCGTRRSLARQSP